MMLLTRRACLSCTRSWNLCWHGFSRVKLLLLGRRKGGGNGKRGINFIVRLFRNFYLIALIELKAISI